MDNKKDGFTLIEVMVVMVIVAILSAITFVGIIGAKKSSRDAERKTDLEQIRSALEMCRLDNGEYPQTIYTGADLVCGSSTYLTGTPTDPSSGDNYYFLRATTSTYILCAHFEGGGTGECSGASCGSAGNCNYQVTNP